MKTIILTSTLFFASISAASHISPWFPLIANSSTVEQITEYQIKNIISVAQASHKAQQLSDGVFSSVNLDISAGAPTYDFLVEEKQGVREIRMVAESGDIFQNQLIDITAPNLLQNIDLTTAITNAAQALQASPIFASLIENSETASYEIFLQKNNDIYSVIVSANTGKVLVISKDDFITQDFEHMPTLTGTENVSLATATDIAEQLIAGKAIFSSFADGSVDSNTITVDVITDKAMTSVLLNSLTGSVISTKLLDNQSLLRKASTQEHMLPIEQASIIARTIKPGQFASAELIIEESQLIYHVTTISHNAVHFVKLNALTGKVLDIQEEVIGDSYAI